MNQNLQDFKNPLPELKFDKNRKSAKFCPCGKDNKDGKFAAYEGYKNKGYCHGCGQTFLPELPSHVQSNSLPVARQIKLSAPEQPPSYIPFAAFDNSLMESAFGGYKNNNFIDFLNAKFGLIATCKVIEQYRITTAKHWPGANIFWQIDVYGNVRTGKIMLYNATTGKRVKEPANCIFWVHKALKTANFNLKQCFFGEHLLSLPENLNKPVAICEAEKTAIIGSLFKPDFVWLAAGGKAGLTGDKCKVLAGRKGILFPDLSQPKPGEQSCFQLWSANKIRTPALSRFVVSDFLERTATEQERAAGLDIADHLLK